MAQNLDGKPIAKAINGFALKFFQKLSTEHQNKNVFFSPYSISAAMSMVLLGSRGPTQTQLKQALEYKDIDEAHEGNKEIRECIQRIDDDCSLEIANRLFPEKSYGLLEDFLRNCEDYYGSEVTPLGYRTDTEGSRKFINDWVSKQTAGKITDLLQPGIIDPLTKLVIANAVYFKADWKEMFDKKATKKKEFQVSRKEKMKVDMMMRMSNYRYRDDKGLNAKILAIPYKGDKVSMVIVLPNRKDGLDLVQMKLGQEDVREVAQIPHLNQVKVCLPRFKLDFGATLIETFKKLGVTDVFSDQADLSGISGLYNV